MSSHTACIAIDCPLISGGNWGWGPGFSLEFEALIFQVIMWHLEGDGMLPTLYQLSQSHKSQLIIYLIL